MIIKFKSDKAGEFIMMGHVALPLLRMMGGSGNTEGAVSGELLDEALQKLETALQRAAAPPASDSDSTEEREEEDRQPKVGVSTRALPLLEMLRKAKAADGYVMWQPD
ncbi:MAG: DUF1840 domain-containing protein [Pseudomonadota bacterium]